MFFRVNGRGISRHKQTIRGGGDYRKLTLKESGGGASEYYRA